MGNNGDLVYFSVNYRFTRGLQLKLWRQYVRKGEEVNPEYGWNPIIPSPLPYPGFLYGLRSNYSYGGLDLKYEITNNLFANFTFQTTRTEIENYSGHFLSDRLNEFYFYLYYGL
jgi:hypothetical protein